MNENNNNNETQFMIKIGLPHILLKNVKINVDGHYEITVRSTLIGTPCHKCGKHITNPHGHGREICLRDLPVFGIPVFIKIEPKRYKCFCCDST